MKMDGGEDTSASMCPNFPEVTEVKSEMWVYYNTTFFVLFLSF